jgi:Spy/CpxP family protein refolding chaperone
MKTHPIGKLTAAIMAICLAIGCTNDEELPGSSLLSTTPGTPDSPSAPNAPTGGNAGYAIEQTVSDEAQRNTIAFDGLAFLTGSLGDQTFLPPGKVADYSGFQYLRDNDATKMGHNRAFVTIIAYNILNILDTAQVGLLARSAQNQVALINQYAYQRFPQIKALRRQLEGDLPAGATDLDKSAVMENSAEFYAIDGQISYNRAKLMGTILNSLSAAQRAQLEALKAKGGIGNWGAMITDPLRDLHLDKDVNVAVMTYASEMYAWYAGSVEADVYFCPERQGTCFGTFYLKDWPAMGNPNYSISTTITGNSGEQFPAALTSDQRRQIEGLVDAQSTDLDGIVATRRAMAAQLRRFMAGDAVDREAVLSLARQYRELDGDLSYLYATADTAAAATKSAYTTVGFIRSSRR